MSTSDGSRPERRKRRRSPRHAGELRAFRFAMVVPNRRAKDLFDACDALLGLRNRLADHLAENRRANRQLKAEGRTEEVHHPGRADLYRLVSHWASEDPKLAAVHSHLRQNVAVRVLEGTRRWLEALREGNSRVRPPRRRDARRYRSFTFPEYGNGCRIENHRVFLSGLGRFRIHDHRRIRGRPKTLTVKFAQGRRWCIVTAQSFARDLHPPLAADDPRPEEAADPGLAPLLTLSSGETFDPPRPLRAAEVDLRRANRVVSRKLAAREAEHARLAEAARAEGKTPPRLKDMPHSNRLKAAIRDLGKRHTKVVRCREHAQKKKAAELADRLSRLAVEEHPLGFMLRNRAQAKAASDRSIGGFKRHLASAFGRAGYVPTPNKRHGIGGNSQTCVCGQPVPKRLKERVHACPACGLVAPPRHGVGEHRAAGLLRHAGRGAAGTASGAGAARSCGAG